MVRTPKEALEFTPEERKSISDLEAGIDLTIMDRYIDGFDRVIYLLPEGTSQRVISSIRRMYEEGGWAVRSIDSYDQVKGNFLIFYPK